MLIQLLLTSSSLIEIIRSLIARKTKTNYKRNYLLRYPVSKMTIIWTHHFSDIFIQITDGFLMVHTLSNGLSVICQHKRPHFKVKPTYTNLVIISWTLPPLVNISNHLPLLLVGFCIFHLNHLLLLYQIWNLLLIQQPL